MEPNRPAVDRAESPHGVPAGSVTMPLVIAISRAIPSSRSARPLVRPLPGAALLPLACGKSGAVVGWVRWAITAAKSVAVMAPRSRTH